MKLIVLVGLFSVILKLKAEDDLTCRIEEPPNVVWGFIPYQITITDTHEGVITKFTTRNIKAVYVQSSDEHYLDVTLENNNLIISTTEQFKNFEKDRKGSHDSEISIEIKCDCEADSNNVLRINVDVTDTNNHDPIFNKNRYEYHFAMAIPVGLDLTVFEAISVSDDDYLNDKIIFSVQSNEVKDIFKLAENGVYSKGHYVTNLKALQNITAPFSEEFTIIATDLGNPSASTTATVVITVSLPESTSENDTGHPPVFSKHLYYAYYFSNNTLNMEENLIIKYGAQENMAIQQSGYETYFKIVQNGMLKEQLDVEIIEPLKNKMLEEDYIVIDVEAKNKGSSYSGLTTLLIHLPKEKNDSTASHPPVFSKHLYFATYFSNNTLNMEENLIIKYGAQENMAIQQSGYEKYFKIVQNALLKEKLDVEIIKPLNNEMIEEDYIVIDVQAKNEGSSYSGFTTLLIHLPNEQNDSTTIHPPLFSKPVYFANYTIDHELQMEETITIKYGLTNNTSVKQSNYEEYIKLILNKAELQVEIIKPLDNQTLENDLIVIEISAENEGLSIPGRTNLIIRLQNQLQESSSCTVHILGYSIGDTIFPLVLFLSAITIIVLVNIVVLSLYFKKNRANNPTVTSIRY